MTPTEDPLVRLVVDGAQVNRELLASALQDKVRIDLARGTFSLQLGMRGRLSNKQLTLVVLLAQKALHLLAGQYADGLRPAAIEAVTGMKGGTLRPILKSLADGGVIQQNEDKAYVVAPYALEEATQLLNDQRREQ